VFNVRSPLQSLNVNAACAKAQKRKAKVEDPCKGSILSFFQAANKKKAVATEPETEVPETVITSEIQSCTQEPSPVLICQEVGALQPTEDHLARLMGSFAARERARAASAGAARATSLTPSDDLAESLSETHCCSKCMQPRSHWKYVARGRRTCRFIGFYRCWKCRHKWTSALGNAKYESSHHTAYH